MIYQSLPVRDGSTHDTYPYEGKDIRFDLNERVENTRVLLKTIEEWFNSLHIAKLTPSPLFHLNIIDLLVYIIDRLEGTEV